MIRLHTYRSRDQTRDCRFAGAEIGTDKNELAHKCTQLPILNAACTLNRSQLTDAEMLATAGIYIFFLLRAL